MYVGTFNIDAKELKPLATTPFIKLNLTKFWAKCTKNRNFVGIKNIFLVKISIKYSYGILNLYMIFVMIGLYTWLLTNSVGFEDPVLGDIGLVGKPHEHGSKGVRVSKLSHLLWKLSIIFASGQNWTFKHGLSTLFSEICGLKVMTIAWV